MSDDLRRRLARAAGDGDLEAARQLVRVLEREDLARDWPLQPETLVRDLTDEDFGALKKWGRKVRVLNVLHRARPMARLEHDMTLRFVSSISAQELANVHDCGPTILASIDAVLARAGLTLKDDPTRRVTRYLENTVKNLSSSPANRSEPMASPPAANPSDEASRAP